MFQEQFAFSPGNNLNGGLFVRRNVKIADKCFIFPLISTKLPRLAWPRRTDFTSAPVKTMPASSFSLSRNQRSFLFCARKDIYSNVAVCAVCSVPMASRLLPLYLRGYPIKAAFSWARVSFFLAQFYELPLASQQALSILAELLRMQENHH